MADATATKHTHQNSIQQLGARTAGSNRRKFALNCIDGLFHSLVLTVWVSGKGYTDGGHNGWLEGIHKPRRPSSRTTSILSASAAAASLRLAAQATARIRAPRSASWWQPSGSSSPRPLERDLQHSTTEHWDDKIYVVPRIQLTVPLHSPHTLSNARVWGLPGLQQTRSWAASDKALPHSSRAFLTLI